MGFFFVLVPNQSPRTRRLSTTWSKNRPHADALKRAGEPTVRQENMIMNKTKENSKLNKCTVTLETINLVYDHELLSDWLHREQVCKWWGDPASRLKLIETTSSEMHAMICASGSPVGYICWQKVDRKELDSVGLFNVPDNVIDIDIFIGDSISRGKGIGPKALDLLFHRLRDNAKTRLAGLVTSINNQPAIYAFEKSGFKKKYQFESTSFGPCWYMEHKIGA